ncbi:MAG: hypothetical protein K2P68_08255 [Sphingomonas sp.]|nr:hypothetical protein [Sphingomonas sp.]
MTARVLPAMALFALIAGCDKGRPDATGAALGEARQLNDAADMLDVNSVNANAVRADTEGQEQK